MVKHSARLAAGVKSGIGRGIGALREIANQVAARLTDVSSLLETGGTLVPERAQFPGQNWRG